jgi:hypothetical protein
LLQFLAEFLHLGARLRIFASHLLDHSAQFAQLRRHIAQRRVARLRRGHGHAFLRSAKTQTAHAKDEHGCHQGTRTKFRVLHDILLRDMRIRMKIEKMGTGLRVRMSN